MSNLEDGILTAGQGATCPNGHEVRPSASFCPRCALPVTGKTMDTWTIEVATGSLVLAHSDHEYAVYDELQSYGRWPMTEEGHQLAMAAYGAHAQTAPPPPPPPPPQSGYPAQPLALTPPSPGFTMTGPPVPQNSGMTFGAPSSPPPPNYVGPDQRTNSTAILAFVFAFLFWPVGIILGHIARRSVHRSGERGAGLALAALIISYIWGAILIVIVIAALATPSASGFNNLTTLQNSVTQQLNKGLSDPSNAAYSPGASITSVICVHSSGTQYSCLVKASGGSSASISVTVSSDGTRWVAN
jgi:hypothetical protein